jgi:hypothetical protein
MRVGLIFECGPAGADKVVCELLARRLKPSIQIASVTLDNKPKLLADCGQATARLLQDGCERVVIVWDLYPPWRSGGAKPCRRTDRQAIAKSLKQAGVKHKLVYLVCIHEELEAWLLADGRALSKVLSRPAHPVRVRDIKKPDQTTKPKTRLIQLFKEKSGKPYSDRVHARLIVEALPDLARIKRCASFVRFAVKATGVTP